MYGMCGIVRERRAKRGASTKIFFQPVTAACRTTRANSYSWHIVLFVSDAKSCTTCMCGIERERRAKRGASAKNFFATGHRACGHRGRSDPSYKKNVAKTLPKLFSPPISRFRALGFLVHYTGLRRFLARYAEKSISDHV
jgi:hypothetical protein